MKTEMYLDIKNVQKSEILGTAIDTKPVYDKEVIFNKDDETITIGNEKISLEKFFLNKLPISDELLSAIEKEARTIFNKAVLTLKNKEEQLAIVNDKITEVKKAIDYIVSLRNKSVYDVIGVINNNLTNIISKDLLFIDNLNVFNGRYSFLTGERIILEDTGYEIIEHSSNYKLEIKLKHKNYINYILFNDSLKTNDHFKVSFMSVNSTLKEVKDLDVNNDPFLKVDINCDRILVEGVGAREIISNIKICIGRNNFNFNRAMAIYECDFEKSKLPNEFLFKCHDDIKIFTTPKKGFEINNLFTYQEFKEKFYLLENIVRTDVSEFINLQDNYLVCFVETGHETLQELKIYGVD